ncbi:MAG: agmatine deiminase family protein [Flavobacteriales bacterium]|nr:agmatine deiminase family protein [Flavobacteriales bacterium]
MRVPTALLCVHFLSGCVQEQRVPEHILPPEWEPHQAVWFTYSGAASDTVLDKVVLAMDPGTLTVCATDNDSLAATIMARWDSMGIGRERYRMEVMGDSLFVPAVRDPGPIFLRTGKGGLAVLDAGWNYYGDLDSTSGMPTYLRAFQDSFPTMMARRMGLPVVNSTLVIEGGSCEINGRGDLLQVEAVTLQRNPGWSKDSMERELERVLGARRVIWLKQGPADDMWYLEPRIAGNLFNQGTGGHVDEFCRFVNDSTVLLAWPGDEELADSAMAVTRRRMAVNLRILHAAGLHVRKVPVPVTEFHAHVLDSTRRYDASVVLRQYPDLRHGDTIQYIPAASYLNYLVTNGRVFAPAYWRVGMPGEMKEKDREMRALLQQYFPDRRIVPVDPRAINRHGGGVHCWSQQQPR